MRRQTDVWEAPLEGDVSWLCRWLLSGRTVNGEVDGLAGEVDRFSGRGVAPDQPSLGQSRMPPWTSTDRQTDRLSLPLSERGRETGNQRQDREEICGAWGVGLSPGAAYRGSWLSPVSALPCS